MNTVRCAYVYCGEEFDEAHSACPACGYPVRADARDLAEALKRLPELPVPRIVDMHQILPSAEGMADAQLAMMDAISVEKALLQSVPSKVKSLLGNRPLLEFAGRHEGRFIVSHFMDPRHPRARLRLKQYRERGVSVIKLLPCLGYEPDVARWRRFFETMAKLGQVAMVHTGFITARHKEEERKSGVFLNSRFGRPIYLDEPARRFPEIQFILCHMGGALWTEEAVEMVGQHENVWGDISGSGIAALRKIGREKLPVRWEKLFWGNDSPAWAYPHNLKLFLSVLKQNGLSGRAAELLYGNGHSFIQRFLT